jgi:hypothetical protein
MIVDVPKVHAAFRVNHVRVVTHQLVEHLALWANDTPQMQSSTFDGENGAQELRRWTSKHGGFQRVQRGIQDIDGGQGVRRERIQQEIEKIGGAGCEPAVIWADMAPDPLHGVDGLAVMGDEIIPAKKNIQPTRGERQRFVIKDHAMDDGVQIVAPVINFGHMEFA